MTEEHKQFFSDFLMVWNPLEYGFWAKIYKRKPVLPALNHVNKRYARNSSSTQGQIFELRPPGTLTPPSYYMQYIIPTIYVGNIHFWLFTFRFILYFSIFYLFL